MAETNSNAPTVRIHETSSLDADFPRNSLYSKDEPEEAPERANINSKPQIKKSSRADQIAQGFKNVVDTVLFPALRKTASTMLKQMVDVIVYQGKTPNGGSRNDDDIYVPYNRSGVRSTGRRARGDYILLDDFYTREDAMAVLRWMRKRIGVHGRVTMGQLYDYLGEPKNATSLDFATGWSDVDDASVIRNGSRWSLELPEPR